MKREETTVTRKFQTTIPKAIRKNLEVKPGQKVTWHIVRSLVVVDTHKKVKDAVKFLTSQTKLDLDAVTLVRETKEDFR
ncbi:MAG: type II toxin-antitoxin system PrlF family antitoxin [Nitrososphaerales archaeon]|jgi:bifunctional DNA-binding transcriptional regulator/antitoxin component of YhaV-PrlF toxin-antitoxin module